MATKTKTKTNALPKLKISAKHRAALEVAAPYLLTAAITAFDLLDSDKPPKGKQFAEAHGQLYSALQIFEAALKPKRR